jgi:hypothetical protein
MTDVQQQPSGLVLVWEETTTFRRELTNGEVEDLTGVAMAEIPDRTEAELQDLVETEELLNLDDPKLEHQAFARIVSLKRPPVDE